MQNRTDIDQQLLSAAQAGNFDLVKSMIEAGANPEVASRDLQYTPLMYAASDGHVEMVKALLEHGANIEAKDCDGDTALIIAVSTRHTEIVEILLEHGANVEAKDAEGDTPLMIAAVYIRNAEMVKILLEHGARKRIKNDTIQAALGCTESNEIIEMIRNFNPLNKLYRTPLPLNVNPIPPVKAENLINQEFLALVQAGNIELVKSKLESGVSIEIKDSTGNTALLVAALKGNVAMIKFLLDHGANIEDRNNDNKTALMLAEEHQNASVIDVLRNFNPLEYQLEQSGFDINNVPDELKCPITRSIMHDPVTAENGQTYEREALRPLFAMPNPADPYNNHPNIRQCPKTRGPIDKKVLTFGTNIAMKNLTRAFVAAKKQEKLQQNQTNTQALSNNPQPLSDRAANGLFPANQTVADEVKQLSSTSTVRPPGSTTNSATN